MLKNYVKAGGKKSFSEYMVVRGNKFAMESKLKSNVFFFDHNLVTDETFVEAHVILCRNVLIYFDEALTRRVVKLFYGSLHNHGFLCLGSRERLMENDTQEQFKLLDINEKVYRKFPGIAQHDALMGKQSME